VLVATGVCLKQTRTESRNRTKTISTATGKNPKNRNNKDENDERDENKGNNENNNKTAGIQKTKRQQPPQ